MSGVKLSFLQWTYPMLLWMMVAFFVMLACKNVVGNGWNPADAGGGLSKVQIYEVATLASN